MLKLEKDEISREIAIRLKPRDRFLNRPFIAALAMALALHFVPFMLIKIAGIRLDFPDLLLPPIVVDADPKGIEEQNSAAEVIENTSAKRDQLEPVPLAIEVPSFERIISLPTFSERLEVPPQDNHFWEAESKALLALSEMLAPEIALAKARIVLSGPLGERKLLKALFDSGTIRGPSSQIEEKRLLYEVLVEGKSGQVVWFSRIQELPRQDLNRKGEEILKSLIFEASAEELVIPGFIEIIFALKLTFERL